MGKGLNKRRGTKGGGAVDNGTGEGEGGEESECGRIRRKVREEKRREGEREREREEGEERTSEQKRAPFSRTWTPQTCAAIIT